MKYFFFIIVFFSFPYSITSNDIYDSSWALLIGIDEYENMQGLDYAVKDIDSIHGLIMDQFKFPKENITILKNDKATKSNILKEFSNIAKNANSNDRIFIFFAGHGDTKDLPGGGEIGFFIPVDGDQNDLYFSAIQMKELETISLLSDAKHILYLVDACYGGLASVGSRGLNPTGIPNYIEKVTKYKSRQIISAGGRGERVIEKSDWGHSAFTKNLLSGLADWMADSDSDGVITAQELGIYLRKKVSIDSNNQQTPKIRNLSSDEGEFVFIRNSDTSINTITSQDNFSNYNKHTAKVQNDPTLEWEYIRDRGFGILANSDWLGLYILYDGFINDGNNAWSLESGALYSNATLRFSQSISFKRYVSSFSEFYLNAGIRVSSFNSINSEIIDNRYYYGISPFFAIGKLGTSNKDRGLWNFIFRNHIELKLGYRFISTEASSIDINSGLYVICSLGFYKRKYKLASKILPVK